MIEEISSETPKQITLKNPTNDEVDRVLHQARKHLDTSITVQHKNEQSGEVDSGQTYRPALDSAFGNDDNIMSLASEATTRPQNGITEIVVKKDPLNVSSK